MFEIEFTSEAIDDLKLFRKFDQRSIFDAIIEQLSYEPVTDTRNRKKLRPNDVAEYELSVSSVFFMTLMKK
jgi:mRNA-degrading endonuclease RelE of RelBE toxin-antitoxin system